jgi:hypothetical protein
VNVEPDDATGCSNRIVARFIYQALKSGVRISGSFTTAVLTSAATNAYCMAAPRLYLKMVQWTGSKVAHKEFAGRKHRIVNSLRCNIASKAKGRHYTTSRGSRCVSQQGWAHDVRSGSFPPLGPGSTSLPWSAAHSIEVAIGADRHSHLVPKGDQARRSRKSPSPKQAGPM